MTGDQEESLVTVWERSRFLYGDDVAQEAALWYLKQASKQEIRNTVAYFNTIARRLKASGLTDVCSRTRFRHRRELRDRVDLDVDNYVSNSPSVERIVNTRLAIQTVKGPVKILFHGGTVWRSIRDKVEQRLIEHEV